MNVVTYTASFGALDPPRTDVLSIPDPGLFHDPRRNARMVKLLSHLYVQADVSVWIDANVELRVDPAELVDMLEDRPVGCFAHWDRDDILEEADAVIAQGKDTADRVKPQVNHYLGFGAVARRLGMTFLLVRRHTPEVMRANERWWAHLCRWSVRDQIAFPVVFDGLVNYWARQPYHGNTPFFIRHRHGTRIGA